MTESGIEELNAKHVAQKAQAAMQSNEFPAYIIQLL